ncbi:SurA N-terminal domain-containing protein [Ornithinimicrobium murale]|uniref:SurA N-terminal domain-containing protein n=1 Tax=Ornithinimicrobium murale TaxID=1050153 RepID=UPI000E0DEE19|nr:SurA N-terminal domain-containing protein [Ornithinimicrobium murale]
MRNKTWMTSLGLVVCLLGAASCSTDSDSGTDDAGTSEGASAAPGSDNAAESAGPDGAGASEGPDAGAGTAGPDQAAAPDLSDVPDVVAEVNGTEISKDEFTEAYTPTFEQASMQAQTTGQPVDEPTLREQTVEGLISSELLMQASEEHGFEASDEDITAELTELAEGNGMASADEFLAALEQQGMSGEEVNAEVEQIIKVDQLIEQEADVTEPTDEEVRARYDELVAQQGGGDAESGSPAPEIPPFEEVQDQVAEQLASERENEAVQTLVEELRTEGEVTVHLESPDTPE